MPPMDEPVPGLPTPIFATLKEEHQQTLVTEMPNGLRVASENRFGEFCTVGGKLTECKLSSDKQHFFCF